MKAFQFHPAVSQWFEKEFGTPTIPQAAGWPAIQAGRHTLIAAPTGSGKTLAAFLAALDSLFRLGLAGELVDETRVLYISPLKALSNDIHKNLETPLQGIRVHLQAAGCGDVMVRSEVRTGDTPAGKRLAIGRKPPHILVTTPESFYLLLTSDSGRRVLGTVRTVIVDEIHAVVGNRRGSHLAISLERLAALTGQPLQRIGLSATQKPVEEVARFLVGRGNQGEDGMADCVVVDAGHRREIDLQIEMPPSPLETVMSNEGWLEVYSRIAALIEQHRTTLVFVNTRRLAERVSHQLAERLGEGKVMSHHGSLSAKLRLDAEDQLKRGELKALVATASLELGIDIGSVDLVCQIGSTRSIAALMQRVGRAEHRRGGLPKGRLFPLTRDELVECAVLVRSIRLGELDAVEIPSRPLDIMAQQIVACAAVEDWEERRLYELICKAHPYETLALSEFESVIEMLSEGFSTRQGRRGALLHRDEVHGRVRGRRGARLTALTSGGAIPDTADYRVVVEPAETFVGTVNEDFAVESMAGDIFQLGNASWRIVRVQSGVVRVEDAHGQPPGIPFWLGEAPARTAELSRAVSGFREGLERELGLGRDGIDWLTGWMGLPRVAVIQLAEFFGSARRMLGVLPTQSTVVMERFFDESGGMQLVIHSPHGNRINRAWGLALRKRFCRKFNFELQAAATDDAIVLSLGGQHSFPLEEVFHYLNSKTVRDLLIQALLDAPMFTVRWRWNASRALAVPRQRGGRRMAPAVQRMVSEDLLAAVFPDQVACLEHIVGDRQVPDHPLVNQTIEDCLTEAMDVDGLIELLAGIEQGKIRCVACDLPEPSPLAHGILNARPYAFLDNAPLEERRTQAVYKRRAGESGSDAAALGALDAQAVQKVREDAFPKWENADELHDALLVTGLMGELEILGASEASAGLLRVLEEEGRAGRFQASGSGNDFIWVAAERLSMVRAALGELRGELVPSPLGRDAGKSWEQPDAIRELVRGRLEISGPITVRQLGLVLHIAGSEIEMSLAALENEGFVLRGSFDAGLAEQQWCERRLLARIHRLTINRLRAEIQPVSSAEFLHYLAGWQCVETGSRLSGVEGLQWVLEMLDGFEAAAAAWEPDILGARVTEYDLQWLDRLSSAGRVGWGRLSVPQIALDRTAPAVPVRSSPIALYQREHLTDWLQLARLVDEPRLGQTTSQVWEALANGGALFFHELIKRTGLLPSQVEQALAELAGLGMATSDSFEGLRALLIPSQKRPSMSARASHRRRTVSSIEFAGRWSALREVRAAVGLEMVGENESRARETAVETYARVLLRRYGVVFRRLLEREPWQVSWFELGRTFRRMEARGEIRGGYFVSGVTGEQFALPEAIERMRSMRKAGMKEEWRVVSGSDPLNLAGILTPGRRVTATANNRLLLCDGTPIAALEAGAVVVFELGEGQVTKTDRASIERSLMIGSLPPALRRYYG